MMTKTIGVLAMKARLLDNYLRIDNSDMEPDKVARLIKETFNL